MRDPYSILGVSRTASAEEIKAAYRALAKKLHPDLNPGRKDIEQKFKEITAAYDLLSDGEKRARFDRGEIDSSGQEQTWSRASQGSPFGSRSWNQRPGAGGDPFAGFGDDLFADLFSGRGTARPGGGGRSGLRGTDVTYPLRVPFTEAALGGRRRLTLSSGKTIDVTIPAGVEEGQKLRLKGQGLAGLSNEPGDAIVEISIEPHEHFTRRGLDLLLELPVSLPEALLGGSVPVPTLDGSVTVKIPKQANGGTVLRVRGKGIQTQARQGDLLVKLRLMLPDKPDAELTQWIEKWAKKHAYDPRRP